MARITTVKSHASGIALCGIDAESVELLPDSEFHFWRIANPPRLTREGRFKSNYSIHKNKRNPKESDFCYLH